jgi:hypothetical protein
LKKKQINELMNADSPPITNQLITIPGYRMNNGTNQSAPIFCPSNPSTYLLKSIIFNNIDSTALATLSTPDQPSSIMSTATTRGVLLVFNNPPISQCYLINFLSITFAVNSIDLNNVKVQFVYDPSNVGGGATRSVASNNGFGNWSYSFTSNANSGLDGKHIFTSNSFELYRLRFYNLSEWWYLSIYGCKWISMSM